MIDDLQEFALVGGPHDGAKVNGTYRIPNTIYVSKVNHADYVAWSGNYSAQFPLCYIFDGTRYYHYPRALKKKKR